MPVQLGWKNGAIKTVGQLLAICDRCFSQSWLARAVLIWSIASGWCYLGGSNKEIGANLYISETTVKPHLRSIFTKLNVLRRRETITAAGQRGLLGATGLMTNSPLLSKG